MANITYGASSAYNTAIYAGPANSSGFVIKDKELNDNVVDMDIYDKDGTLKSKLGVGAWNSNISKVEFELDSTGCTSGSITFIRDYPDTSTIDLMDRISIKLFNSPYPFWTGYVESIPMKGTTDITSYQVKLKGYYQRLKNVYLTKTYTNMKVSAIAADILAMVTNYFGTSFSTHEIVDTDYIVNKVIFDHQSLADVLEDLKLFAIDYVAGIDESNVLFFKPRSEEINEEARFWVGQHISSFQPTRDISKIYNRLYVKYGSTSDDGSSQYAGVVEDAESIEKYGLSEKIVTLPSSYDKNDALKWGEYQLNQCKDEIKSATCKNVKIVYPLENGDFYVRHLSTYGYTRITDLEGVTYDLPISKIKYSVDKYGVSLSSLTLGEKPYDVVQYFANLEREVRINELMQQTTV